MIARQTVLSDVTAILVELMGDWEFEGEVREDSLLLEELGLESIDAVALGCELEEKYQRSLPFARFLARLQKQQRRDFTVGELVDHVTRALAESEPESAAGPLPGG